ncbi:glucose 1-dehydrogenase [Paenarthrobacter sp. Z7-10]|uniref:SDR family NAD(P)-dependent oxidoreductase n=1 Tax=Paenarthrobacter sp. Z7-10 TaxID=2787635 RepID=UPI0022A9511B|nr:glucose 1-dehydrogenase [Paenarthrobacter sp. Z7-10]MCZ2401615.1 glucose 1-dehydrogenase [Paenarthrobacter sp. Z7-10]
MPVLDRFSMVGQTAVVTGATRGLGRAFAGALAEAGANIVIVGRDAAAAAEVEAEVAAIGVRALTVLADVSIRSDLEAVLTRTKEAFGRADVLVNNAGTCIHRPALEVTDDDWRAVMNVNLDGVWMASQVFGRHMIEAGGGSIVNIGSMSASIVNRPQWQPAYNASKAAVHHLTRSLAAEWAPLNVRVNALAPGYMHTDMSPIDEPQFHRHWIEDTPQQRAGEPDELGPAVVFLASRASSFMTGSVLTVDGGYSIY